MPERHTPELFAERPVSSRPGSLRPLRRGPPYAVRRALTLTVLGLAVGGIAYGLYSYGNKVGMPAAIPTVKSIGVYRQKPQEPGGIDIPHQDVEVYHALDSNEGAAKPEPEHLLPGPEVPQLTPPVAPAPSGAVSVPVQPAAVTPANDGSPESLLPATPLPAAVPPTVTQPVTAILSAPDAVPQTPAAAKAVSVPQPSAAPPVEPASTAATDEAPKAAIPATASGVAPTAAPVKNGHAVQLASIPDEAQAKAEVAHLQAKYAAILGDAHLHIVRADLGPKGIYYRIQSQNLPEAQADRLCSALKAQNAGCFLVRP